MTITIINDTATTNNNNINNDNQKGALCISI